MVSKEFIKENFYFSDEDLIFFNHGSDGICPKPILEEKFNILRKFEEDPVTSFAVTMFDGCLENTKILADKIGVCYKNLAIVGNVTTAFCSVLQSIQLNLDEEFLITNFTYSGMKRVVDEFISKKGFVIRTLQLTLPLKCNEEIVNLYEQFVIDHPKIKYAIIDHIPSSLPLVQPVKEIIKVLRRYGIFVIVDGAHALGQINGLNMSSIDADVYIGGLHKWCFLPRGLAFIAIRDSLQIHIQPSIISFLHKREFYLRFIYTGTKDISNVLCIKKAFAFIDQLGGFECISSVVTEIMEKGMSFLEDSWNVTRIRFPEMAPYTTLIPLPKGFCKYKDDIYAISEKPFRREYYSYVCNKLKFAVKLILLNDMLHFRICCHIYNTHDNFIQFSKRVLQWLESLNNGEPLFSSS